MNELVIIAKLYELLAGGSHREFLAASRMPELIPELVHCLEDLAAARKRLTGTTRKRASQFERSDIHPYSTKSVTDALKDLERFPKNQMLATFLNSLGLNLSFNKRDGRTRMCDKLLRGLERLPPQRRQDVINRIVDMTASDTFKWFQAIRGNPD